MDFPQWRYATDFPFRTSTKSKFPLGHGNRSGRRRENFHGANLVSNLVSQIRNQRQQKKKTLHTITKTDTSAVWRDIRLIKDSTFSTRCAGKSWLQHGLFIVRQGPLLFRVWGVSLDCLDVERTAGVTKEGLGIFFFCLIVFQHTRLHRPETILAEDRRLAWLRLHLHYSCCTFPLHVLPGRCVASFIDFQVRSRWSEQTT